MRVIAREGFDVPVATIAAEAGVGVATFYRGFSDRTALMRELQLRAYDALIGILDDIKGREETGLSAIEAYLRGALAMSDRLILPLHGVRPLVDAEAVARRERIDGELERFIVAGRDAGEITTAVNATDVIICSALVTQAFRFGADWDAAATRHIRIFIGGLTAATPMAEPAVTRSRLEAALQRSSREGAAPSATS